MIKQEGAEVEKAGRTGEAGEAVKKAMRWDVTVDVVPGSGGGSGVQSRR